MSEYFGIDPSYNDGYPDDEIPEPEGYRFQFRDGSAVTILEMEDPITEHETRHSLAHEFMAWYEDAQPDSGAAIKYLKQNYQ